WEADHDDHSADGYVDLDGDNDQYTLIDNSPSSAQELCSQLTENPHFTSAAAAALGLDSPDAVNLGNCITSESWSGGFSAEWDGSDGKSLFISVDDRFYDGHDRMTVYNAV